MAVPSPGEPSVDLDVEQVIKALKKITGKVANNLSFPILGELVEQSARVSGLAVRYYGIVGQRKVGGHKGADRSNWAR
jgi:hypothetical protein